MIRVIENSPLPVLIKRSLIYDVILQTRRRREFREWERRGKPLPPPDLVKQRAVKAYGERFSLGTLVETGTFQGNMVFVMRRQFRRIFSIELDQVLYEHAKQRFATMPHITILHGDSSFTLAEILSDINTPCLFWLDAHYSGGVTARGDLETPIVRELRCILDHHVKTHIILIDDARCFVGQNDYPRIDELEAMVHKNRPGLVLEVRDDIIRIHESF